MNRLFAASLCLVTTIALHAQEPEGAGKAKTAETKGDLSATAFAKTGMTGSSVGITLDDQGNAYVTNTNRRNNGEIDIRKNKTWLLESLSLTSAEDRIALIKKNMPDTWKDLAKFKEQIIKVSDEELTFLSGATDLAEGARAAAAADGGCTDAATAATSIATRIGGGWVRDLDVTCTGEIGRAHV